MRLRWTRPALRDVAEIHAYLAERNPAAALKVARAIRAQAEALADHPRIGRPGRVAGTRELVIAGYDCVVAYRVAADAIDLLAVRHSARMWPDGFG